MFDVVGHTIDRSPLCHRADTWRQKTIYTYIHTDGQIRIAS